MSASAPNKSFERTRRTLRAATPLDDSTRAAQLQRWATFRLLNTDKRMPEFRAVNPKDRILYELMPILIAIGPRQELRFYGSCFIGWSHMAITARHVVEELLKHDPGIAENGSAEYEYWVVQVQWQGDEHRYVVWTIDSIGVAPNTDVAIIWLRGLDENAANYKSWKTMPVTLDPPRLGATVRAFGIHNVRFDGSRVGTDGKFEHIAFESDRSTSTGTVRQLYWQQRDRGLYNFPCFEVDAKFEGGMSGGLVIDELSRLCGIVCGSLPATSPDEGDISYVTMLWPMMAIPVHAKLVPGGIEGKWYRLKDLAAQGIFNVEGWDRVVIEESARAGVPPVVRFRPKI